METRKFYTLIKADHKLGGNLYVKGRVHGIMTAVCCENPGKDIMHGTGLNESGAIFIIETTEERYNKFAEMVEQLYKELCIFDYKESE